MADFEAENDFEMSVKAGSVVVVTAQLNEMWLEGQFNGQTGIYRIVVFLLFNNFSLIKFTFSFGIPV